MNIVANKSGLIDNEKGCMLSIISGIEIGNVDRPLTIPNQTFICDKIIAIIKTQIVLETKDTNEPANNGEI
jgi:hypothetical protein